MVVFGQKIMYLGKNCCIGAKVDVIQAKVVVFGLNGCIRAKWLCSGKSCFIQAKVVVLRANVLCSVKCGCIRAKCL